MSAKDRKQTKNKLITQRKNKKNKNTDLDLKEPNAQKIQQTCITWDTEKLSLSKHTTS